MQKNTKSKNIYAVVVTYNPEKSLLEQQYESLLPQVSRIIYVDNGSAKVYSEKFAQSYTIRNTENYGLGKAQNQGIEFARKKDADYILLLDQDSVLEKGMVSVLLTEYNEYSKKMKIAAIGPAFKSGFDESVQDVGILSVGFRMKKTKIVNTSLVSYIIASGSLIPVSVFDEVGVIDERLFIDGLDMEWCLRACSKGFKIIQTSKTHLIHKLGNGNKDLVLSHSPLREYYIIRNSFLFLRFPHVPLSYKGRKIVFTFGRTLYSLFHGYFDYFKMSLKAIRDSVFWR